MGRREVINRIYKNTQKWMVRREVQQSQVLQNVFNKTRSDMETELFKLFSEKFSGQPWTLAEMRKANRYQSLMDQIDNMSSNLKRDSNIAMENFFSEHYSLSYYRAAWELDKTTPGNISPVFNTINTDAVKALINTPWRGAMFSDRLGVITDETASKIQQSLTRSMINGEGVDQAARRIRDLMGNEGKGAASRARGIARTEMTRAQELARYKVLNENKDLIETAVWHSNIGRCDICAELNGKKPKRGEAFVWYSKELGEDVFGPPAHPNCRCDVDYEMVSWDDMATDLTRDIPAKYQPFNEWAAERDISISDIEKAFNEPVEDLKDELDI